MLNTRTLPAVIAVVALWGCGAQPEGSGDGGVIDAGQREPGRDAGTPCSALGACAAPEVCDFSARHCRVAGECNAAAPQPDVCGYAQLCSAASTCAEIARPACSNFDAAGPSPAVFNPTTGSGPIIYRAEADTSPPAQRCFKGYFVHSVYLSAYRDSDWPSSLAGLPPIWLVHSTGYKVNVYGMVPDSYYVPTGRTMRFRYSYCTRLQESSTWGFFMPGGNEVCVDTRPAPGTAPCTQNSNCDLGTCTLSTGMCN